MDDIVYQEKKPILGICVGMQIMAEESEEGEKRGLCWISGCVKKLKNNTTITDKSFIVPHMGWNNIKINNNCELFKGINEKARFYFLHSYYFLETKKKHVLAYTNYDGEFCSSFRKKKIFGVQFHPEKSHMSGIHLLKNFSRI